MTGGDFNLKNYADGEVGQRRKAKTAKETRELAERIGAQEAGGIKQIVRYGEHEDASIAIELANGKEVRFERQADLFVPAILMRRAALAGCDIDHISGPTAHNLAKAIVTHAKVVAEHAARDDRRAELRRMLNAFANAGTAIQGDLHDKRVRYERFRDLRDHAPADDGHSPPATLAIVLTDTNPDPAHAGDQYVRVDDVVRALRYERKEAVAWPTMHSLALEAGWRHPGELWQRKPGDDKARVRVNVYIVPAGWDVSDLPDGDSEND